MSLLEKTIFLIPLILMSPFKRGLQIPFLIPIGISRRDYLSNSCDTDSLTPIESNPCDGSPD